MLSSFRYWVRDEEIVFEATSRVRIKKIRNTKYDENQGLCNSLVCVSCHIAKGKNNMKSKLSKPCVAILTKQDMMLYYTSGIYNILRVPLDKGKGRGICLLSGHQRTNGPIARDANSRKRPLPPGISTSRCSYMQLRPAVTNLPRNYQQLCSNPLPSC